MLTSKPKTGNRSTKVSALYRSETSPLFGYKKQLTVDRVTERAFEKKNNKILTDSGLQESFLVSKPDNYSEILKSSIIYNYFTFPQK